MVWVDLLEFSPRVSTPSLASGNERSRRTFLNCFVIFKNVEFLSFSLPMIFRNRTIFRKTSKIWNHIYGPIFSSKPCLLINHICTKKLLPNIRIAKRTMLVPIGRRFEAPVIDMTVPFRVVEFIACHHQPNVLVDWKQQFPSVMSECSFQCSLFFAERAPFAPSISFDVVWYFMLTFYFQLSIISAIMFVCSSVIRTKDVLLHCIRTY